MTIIENGKQILDKIDYNEFVVIWGTGVYGLRFQKEIFSLERKEKIYFCDNNVEDRVSCPKLLAPDELREKVKEQNIIVVICVKSDDAVCQISTQLSAMGISDQNIYRYKPNVLKLSMSDEIKQKKSKGYFNGKKQVFPLDDLEAVKLIGEKIETGEAFFYSRWGGVEAKAVFDYVMGFPSRVESSLMNNAGVFPLTTSIVHSYCEEAISAAKQIDILCAWFHIIDGEDLLFRWYSPDAVIVGSATSSPFLFENAWTGKLKNKRVLVIHPYAELIEKQYKKRELLWENHDEILPQFDLITYKAVQSLGGSDEYDSWVDALNKMKNDIEKLTFDIALIGCGAYGMPLGAFIKDRMKKPAIHIGGMLQILFGIKGTRWEGKPYNYDTKFFNEFWVRPGEALKPKNYMNVEDGCYW